MCLIHFLDFRAMRQLADGFYFEWAIADLCSSRIELCCFSKRGRKEQALINNNLLLAIWQLAITSQLFARVLLTYVHALEPPGTFEQKPTVTLVEPL